MMSASQRPVKMKEFAVKPPADTRANARMITLEITAIVSVVVIVYTC